MTQIQHNQLVSFIWNIANDVLVNVYNKGDYRKVILPMIVLRRFDAVLEDTKKEVLAMKERLTAANIIQQDEALCAVAGQAFCNSSPFTLKDLKSRTNSQQLKLDFIAYLDGFSANVQDIITKFKFRNEIDTLVEGGVLGLLIEKFVDNRINLSNRPVLFDDGSVRLPALDNHSIGTVFEELLRRFNEENNVTEAGEHFTPRDIVTLMAEIAFVPIMDKITDSSYLIYDGACGTGGILSVSEERLQQLAEARGKRINTHIFGQELQPETYATCKSDLLIKGDGEEANNISFGSTISEDGKAGMKFDFCISNPPFGTPWKRDLENWGLKDKKDITDGRFLIAYDGNPAYSLVPNIGDPQMLFLANNISRMKDTTELGTRIVEVHNGSSLFTGNAGGGESNLRRYIIENDLLEAIKAEGEAAMALQEAISNSNNIINGICNAIVKAEQNMQFKATIRSEHLAQLQQLLNQTIETWKTMLENHRSEQAKMLTEHEFNMRKILRRNEGVWFSDFWMKVLVIFLFVYTVVLGLVVYCST